jgi:hypothetical protein
MSQPSDGLNPNDPFAAWRTWRDASLDAWAKSMTSMVNTESFSQAIGAQLDAMLAVNGPLQQVVHQSMERYLAQANLPSRSETTALAARLTQIEMRLDDMQAQVEHVIHLLERNAAPSIPAAQLEQLTAQLAAVSAALAAAGTVPGAASEPASAPAAPRRSRKPRTTGE